MSNPKKLILVIGATGAQGLAVIDKLLAPTPDGAPSPYAVRALTRDPEGRRAIELSKKGVECVKGAFDDFDAVRAALQGVYGAWVNTDGFTVGEQAEVYAGIRIFEIAKELGTVKHYVWSNLDYCLKLGNYKPIYRCGHYDGKGRVADWMTAQESVVNENGPGMTWSIVTSGPYMDMLTNVMFGPLKKRPDGTFVFLTPVGNGHVPMIALSDLGFFARYTFDNRTLTSGKDLKIASDIVGWEYLRATFERVTGQRAEVVYQSIEEWMGNLTGTEQPVAWDAPPGGLTWKQNFSAFWAMWRDDIVSRDMDWVRRVNPNGHTLESWMREKGYMGKLLSGTETLLKNAEDKKVIGLNIEVVAKL